jgi:uncharacterized protein DUF3617
MIKRQLGYLTIFSLFFLITTVTAHAATPATPAALINPGKWEITMHNTEPIDSPPMVNVTCIGPDEIARIAPPVSKASDECKLIAPGTLDRGVLMFMLNCPKLHRKTTSKTTFAGDTFSGTLVMEHGDGPTYKQTIEGKRLGACDDQQ